MMGAELTIAILAGLGGMLGWGLADFFAKKTIDRIGDVQSLAWAGIFGTGGFLLVIAYQVLARGEELLLPDDIFTWVGLLFFGALQATVYLFVYRGFSKGHVAVLAPLFSSFAGWTALISIVFLGEVASWERMTTLAIVFVGLMLLSIDYQALIQRQIRLHKGGVTEVIIATILAAVWTLLWDRFVHDTEAISFAFWMFLFMTAAVFAFGFFKKLPFKVDSTSTWTYVGLIGICETVAYLAITIGYSATTLTSVVALVSGAFALPTIMLARFFLGERPNMVQNIGSIITIVGIALLSFA